MNLYLFAELQLSTAPARAVHSKVGAIEREVALKSGDRAGARLATQPEELDRHGDSSSHAADGDLAGDVEHVLRIAWGNCGTGERHHRVVLRVEKIFSQQSTVAGGVSRIEAGKLHREVHLGTRRVV